MKMKKLDAWLIASWLVCIIFIVTDIILTTQGFYLSTTLEVLVGTIFGAVETICCTAIKTNETKASYQYQLSQIKATNDFQMKQMETNRKYQLEDRQNELG